MTEAQFESFALLILSASLVILLASGLIGLIMIFYEDLKENRK